MQYRQAIIPAAGKGERLDRPDTPKPLVEVGGRPLILRVLSQLENAGVEEAYVVVGHKGKQVSRALYEHPDLNLDVEFIDHPEWKRGLATSVLAARSEIDGPFLISMADHFFEWGIIDDFVDVELGDETDVCVKTDPNLADIYNVDASVKVDVDGNRVKAIGRDLSDFNAVDMGLFACKQGFFEALEEVAKKREPAHLDHAMATLAESGRISSRTIGEQCYWHDVDTPAALIRAEMEYRNTKRQEAVERATESVGSTRPAHEYTFTTGEPVDTDVYVQRGFVRNPSQLELIPPERSSSPIFVFTDVRVNKLYGDDFVQGLRNMGYDVQRVVMPEGEEAKTLSNYTNLVEHVLAEGIDERSVLISLGGGAVCNVCGFIASTLYRGIGLIHVPTTLMAQCDAAIGHKQGVNGKRGKNLVGAYYPPIAIAVDIEVLSTLDDWLIPDGLSEVIKHALGQDKAYLERLLDFNGDMRDPDFLEYVVRKNIELKCELMATDPKEKREAMVLQYGHTTGHPIEYLSGYEMNHGQSVAVGMMVASRVSEILGGCDEQMIDLHREVISKFDLPTEVPAEIDADDVMAMMQYNKKYLTEGTRMALVDEPGKLWSVEGEYAIPVPDQVIREAIIRHTEGSET